MRHSVTFNLQSVLYLCLQGRVNDDDSSLVLEFAGSTSFKEAFQDQSEIRDLARCFLKVMDTQDADQ